MSVFKIDVSYITQHNALSVSSIMMGIFSCTVHSAHSIVSGLCQNKLSRWCMTSVKSFRMDSLLDNENCSPVRKRVSMGIQAANM